MRTSCSGWVAKCRTRAGASANTTPTYAAQRFTAPESAQRLTTPYTGLSTVVRPDGQYQSQERFDLYRWHIMDPIRFEHDLKVTIQALGWKSDGTYLPLQDDIASVAYWYQSEPHQAFPKLPTMEELEIH